MTDNNNGSVLDQLGVVLAPVDGNEQSNFWTRLDNEWTSDQNQNTGYVWTVSINGDQEVKAMGLAGCTYKLELSASHVGPTMYGVYKGRLRVEYNGDLSGVKLLLALAAVRTNADLNGWFESDPFLFRIEPYVEGEEYDFVSTFDQTEELTVKSTGNAAADAIAQSYVNMFQNLTNSIISNSSNDELHETMGIPPEGFWYAYTVHMTDGDMSDFITMNGGPLIFSINASAYRNKEGNVVDSHAKVRAIFTPTFTDNDRMEIEDPVPCSIKLYNDGKAAFTIYNAKDPGISVAWIGTVDKIPVSSTTVVK